LDPIQIFLEFLRQALKGVNIDYYSRYLHNEGLLNNFLVGEHQDVKDAVSEYFHRHGERVFCYELYHQIRQLMELHIQKNPDSFQGVLLESELKKELIQELLMKYFNVEPLDKEYIPDFILHTPGNFDTQYLIVEVKTNPNLSFSGMTGDLLKIQEFITKYRYEKGLFLTINTDPVRISEILQVGNNKTWLSENILTPDRVIIMCKQNNNIDLFERSIQQVLDQVN